MSDLYDEKVMSIGQWVAVVLLIGVVAWFITCGYVLGKTACGQEFCPTSPCTTDSQCGRGCACVYFAGDALGTCVGGLDD